MKVRYQHCYSKNDPWWLYYRTVDSWGSHSVKWLSPMWVYSSGDLGSYSHGLLTATLSFCCTQHLWQADLDLCFSLRKSYQLADYQELHCWAAAVHIARAIPLEDSSSCPAGRGFSGPIFSIGVRGQHGYGHAATTHSYLRRHPDRHYK